MTLNHPAPRVIVAVEFLVSGVTPVRICSDNVQRNINGDVYESHPELEVSLPDLTGELPIDGATIQVALHRLSFVRNMVSDRTYYSSVLARVRKVIVAGDSLSGHQSFKFVGPVTVHDRKEGIVTLSTAGAFAKAESDSPWVADTTCVAKYGDLHGCTASPESHVESGTLVSHTNGVVVQVTGLPVKPLHFWMPGSITSGVFRVPVHYWRTGDMFELSRRIPQDWENTLDSGGTVAVEMRPGCLQTPGDCSILNPNPEQFKGYAIASPARHPILEVGEEDE